MSKMYLLDENISDRARDLLRGWRIRCQKIGSGVGQPGMSDEDVIPLLHELKAVTFFTLDEDYYQQHLCHARYCLVHLDVAEKLTAETIRRFLRHPQFRTWAQRKGKVVRVSPAGMRVWQLHAAEAESISWPS
jgi:hypothetical protein